MKTIDSLRQEIDQLHRELFELLVRRREMTMAIWQIKKSAGEPFFDPQREEKIVKDFLSLNKTQDPAFDALLEGVMSSVLREYEKYLQSQFK